MVSPLNKQKALIWDTVACGAETGHACCAPSEFLAYRICEPNKVTAVLCH